MYERGGRKTRKQEVEKDNGQRKKVQMKLDYLRKEKKTIENRVKKEDRR